MDEALAFGQVVMFHAVLVLGGLLGDETRSSVEYGRHRPFAHRSDSIKLHRTPLHSLPVSSA